MRHKRVTVVVGGVVIETTHSFSLGYEEIKGKEKKKKERKEKKNETTNVCRTAPNSNHLSRASCTDVSLSSKLNIQDQERGKTRLQKEKNSFDCPHTFIYAGRKMSWLPSLDGRGPCAS